MIGDILAFIAGIYLIYSVSVENCYYSEGTHLFIKSFEGSRKQRRFFIPVFLRRPYVDRYRITYIGFVSSLIVLLPLAILVPAIVFLYFMGTPLAIKLLKWWFRVSALIVLFTGALSFMDYLLLSTYKLITRRRR